MKYLIVTLLLLAGCTEKQPDPTCLDGYLVGSFSNSQVALFCTGVYISDRGIQGYDCSEIPYATPRAVADVRISEGAVFKTKCFNRLHK